MSAKSGDRDMDMEKKNVTASIDIDETCAICRDAVHDVAGLRTNRDSDECACAVLCPVLSVTTVI